MDVEGVLTQVSRMATCFWYCVRVTVTMDSSRARSELNTSFLSLLFTDKDMASSSKQERAKQNQRGRDGSNDIFLLFFCYSIFFFLIHLSTSSSFGNPAPRKSGIPCARIPRGSQMLQKWVKLCVKRSGQDQCFWVKLLIKKRPRMCCKSGVAGIRQAFVSLIRVSRVLKMHIFRLGL